MAVSIPARERTRRSGRRLWTVQEFLKAGDKGIFRPDERLELLEGEIVRKMSPQKSYHAFGIQAAGKRMSQIFAEGFDVRIQLPLELGHYNLPEPDVCVVKGSFRDYARAHPSEAVLVIEIADTTLRRDRKVKAPIYARFGIRESWILDLTSRILEVRRDPAELVDQPGKFDYRQVLVLSETESISPIAAPDNSIRIGDLLP